MLFFMNCNCQAEVDNYPPLDNWINAALVGDCKDFVKLCGNHTNISKLPYVEHVVPDSLSSHNCAEQHH
jgi:hypothetical protein